MEIRSTDAAVPRDRCAPRRFLVPLGRGVLAWLGPPIMLALFAGANVSELPSVSAAPPSAGTCRVTAPPQALGCAGQPNGPTAANQAAPFEIRCQPGQTSADAGTTPVPLGARPSATGVLPAALLCEAGFWAGARLIVSAPGTIEVSTRQGTLLDLRGSVTTTLRAGCAQALAAAVDAASAGPDGCLGVRFAVLGRGVGQVDLRARFEPVLASAASPELETTTVVSFVAPATRPLLVLFANPLGVGETSTVSVRFNRTSTVNGQRLVNPTTGGTLRISLGTPLNGTVTFTSADPTVASFVGGPRATISSGMGTGTEPSSPALIREGGASIRVRCGSVVPGNAGDFSSYFGGCESSDVTVRANGAGTTTITATFVADLPNAFPDGAVASTMPLEVVRVLPSSVRLSPGCTNVVAPATEPIGQSLARAVPAAAAISIWRQLPGMTTFQAATGGDRAPPVASNLTDVAALDAVFVCVNAAATFRLT